MIAELWEKGMTSGQIAEHFKISRNAVMGVVHRLRNQGKIKKREQDKKTPVKLPKLGGPLTMRKLLKKIKTKKKAKSVNQIELPFSFIEPEIVAPSNCSIMELTPSTCRYVVGEVRAEKTLYCGNKVHDRNFCREHFKMCYYTPSKASFRSGLENPVRVQ